MRLAATNLSLPFNADESALMMLLASELRVKQEDIHCASQGTPLMQGIKPTSGASTP